MTVKELAQVMGKQFIAVEVDGKITYSGNASALYTYTARREVKEIIVPKNEYQATIIKA